MSTLVDCFLLVTGYPENPKSLVDKAFINKTLEEIPKIIGMNTIRDPVVLEASNNPGLEGYVPIDESNITISTYTNDSRFVACIHSCKHFDFEKVVDYLNLRFSTIRIAVKYVNEHDFENYQ